MRHLRYSLYVAMQECEENRHPQEVMRELGIKYKHATPQTLGEEWWFWNCENVPDDLPEWLSDLGLDPIQCIGYGLSEEIAKEIIGK